MGHCINNKCDGAYFKDEQHLYDWGIAFLAEKILFLNKCTVDVVRGGPTAHYFGGV